MKQHEIFPVFKRLGLYYSFTGGPTSWGRLLFFISLNSNSKRAYRWANSLLRSASLEIATEKWRLIKMRNKKANKKMVEEGVTAPIKWVIHFKRSNHNARRRMMAPVISHNQEYSSRSFRLLTNSMMSNNITMPKARAMILFRIGMISSFFNANRTNDNESWEGSLLMES